MQDRTINGPDNVEGLLICSVAMTLGIPRLAELLVVFEARIEWLSAALVASPYNHVGILATLHQSRGSAATLGFTELERVLADTEIRLSPRSDNAARGSSGVVASEIDAHSLSRQAVDAIGEAWQASLTAATVYVPGLRHHRPFGSNK